MNFLFFVFICITSSLFSKEHKHDLAVCAIFRDDAAYIPEWIEFHENRGVTHFFLYEHMSSDNFEYILHKYVKSGLVDIIPWHFEVNKPLNWGQIQCGAYMDCIEKNRGSCKWIACIDTDEFLFSPKVYNLPYLLKFYKSYGGVSVNWVLYGNSGVDKIYPGEKMTDKLVWRGIIDSKVNTHVKTIVQPKYVIGCVNPHFFIYKDGKHAVTENKDFIEGAFSKFVSVERFRINHYWQRDENFFNTVFIPRKKRWGFSEEFIEKSRNLYNDEFDNILQNKK